MASPNSNFDEIIATTLKNRRKAFADNVLENIPLLKFLNERGNVQMEDGGETLVEELEFSENATFKFYQGFETLDISPQEVFTAAEYNWKQAAVTVTVDGLTQRKNSGVNAMINLVKARVSNAEKTMMNNLSSGIFSDGTGFGGKEIGGLQLLVADDPTSGVVGGIDRATNTFWQNSFQSTATYDATTIESEMESLWLKVFRNNERPDFIVNDSVSFQFFWSALQSFQRITTADKGERGFESLTFHGPGGAAPVFFDENCPAKHMYFLNLDFFHWRVHKDANMEPLLERQSINQDASVTPIIWMGNLTLSNAARNGVMFDSTP